MKKLWQWFNALLLLWSEMISLLINSTRITTSVWGDWLKFSILNLKNLTLWLIWYLETHLMFLRYPQSHLLTVFILIQKSIKERCMISRLDLILKECSYSLIYWLQIEILSNMHVFFGIIITDSLNKLNSLCLSWWRLLESSLNFMNSWKLSDLTSHTSILTLIKDMSKNESGSLLLKESSKARPIK